MSMLGLCSRRFAEVRPSKGHVLVEWIRLEEGWSKLGMDGDVKQVSKCVRARGAMPNYNGAWIRVLWLI